MFPGFFSINLTLTAQHLRFVLLLSCLFSYQIKNRTSSVNIKINPLLANRNAKSFISISLCDVLSKACDKGAVENGLLIRKAKACRGEGVGWGGGGGGSIT